MARFEAEGFQTVALATSHAFHSRIVAPANEPLRRFLEGLDVKWPKIPITSNVDADGIQWMMEETPKLQL